MEALVGLDHKVALFPSLAEIVAQHQFAQGLEQL